MSQNENIFCFNHIDKSKTKEEIQEIKELYKYYHFKFWVYQTAYKHFKKLNLLLNMASTGLIVIGTVVGVLTANPAILGSISGAGFRGGSRIFLRRGCTRLLLYFNTNKPHSFFFCRIPVVLENRRSSRGGGGGAHPLHPPPRSAPAI